MVGTKDSVFTEKWKIIFIFGSHFYSETLVKIDLKCYSTVNRIIYCQYIMTLNMFVSKRIYVTGKLRSKKFWERGSRALVCEKKNFFCIFEEIVYEEVRG